VEICNLALARLGDNATVASIDPPEGSMQSEHCAMFFPLARDSMLELHAWNFATRRARLAQLAIEPPDWTYAYARPLDALRAIALFSPELGSVEDELLEFESSSDAKGNAIILTHLPDAHLRYDARVVDAGTFPPLFVDSLAWLLAAYLAGPVMKGDAGAKMSRDCQQAFRATLSAAIVSDSNQHRERIDFTAPWIDKRK
jgi:hypothetical protein